MLLYDYSGLHPPRQWCRINFWVGEPKHILSSPVVGCFQRGPTIYCMLQAIRGPVFFTVLRFMFGRGEGFNEWAENTICSDAGFSLSEYLNELKVVGYWHTIFFPGHVVCKETILFLLHLYAGMFDLCIYLSVWSYLFGKWNQMRRKIERPVDEYKLFINSVELENELWNRSVQNNSLRNTFGTVPDI